MFLNGTPMSAITDSISDRISWPSRQEGLEITPFHPWTMTQVALFIFAGAIVGPSTLSKAYIARFIDTSIFYILKDKELGFRSKVSRISNTEDSI